jgi:hypothetical protein
LAWALAIARGAAVYIGSDLAADLTAFTFGVIGVLALAWGVLHMWLGAALRRYRPRPLIAGPGHHQPGAVPIRHRPRWLRVMGAAERSRGAIQSYSSTMASEEGLPRFQFSTRAAIDRALGVHGPADPALTAFSRHTSRRSAGAASPFGCMTG